MIVETEAYSHEDPGLALLPRANGAQRSHVRPARPRLCLSLLWPALVPEFRVRPRRAGKRRAVRSLEPTCGLDTMRDTPEHRGCRAPLLGARTTLPGARGDAGRMTARPSTRRLSAFMGGRARSDVSVGRRIGITQAPDKPWRFGPEGIALRQPPVSAGGGGDVSAVRPGRGSKLAPFCAQARASAATAAS